MGEHFDRKKQKGIQFSLAFFVLATLAIFFSFFEGAISRIVHAEIKLERLTEEHTTPVQQCSNQANAGLDYSDVGGQIVQEFNNAILRLTVADRVFRCRPGYHKNVLTIIGCAPPPYIDITYLVKPMFPRLTAESEDLYDTFKENDDAYYYPKDRILSLLKSNFTFEPGIPVDLTVPDFVPPVDEIQCGYCQPSTSVEIVKDPLLGDAAKLKRDYRVCLLFRKGVLRDLSATVISKVDNRNVVLPNYNGEINKGLKE